MANPFCSTDIVLAAFNVGFNFWQFSAASQGGRKWYEAARRKQLVYCAPPGAVFGIVWSVLFTAMGISTYVYARNFKGETFYTATLWIILFNTLINKAWSWMFFDKGWRFMSLMAIGLFILPTAILVAIFFALDGAWLSFGLWAAYPVWLVVALMLNWQWFSKGLPTKDVKQADIEQPMMPPRPAVAAHAAAAPMSTASGKTLRFELSQ